MDAIESTVAIAAVCEKAYPGASVPYTGTEFCGLPRMAMVSLGDSHGLCFGSSLKSVNQEQAPSVVTRARAEKRPTLCNELRSAGPSRCSGRPWSALIANLECTVLAQQLRRLRRAVRTCGDPDAEIALAEARIVAHREREARQACEHEQAEHRGERADEHHQLEADDRVGHPARDGLATDDERPVVGHPDRDPVAEAHAQQSTDEREAAHVAVRGSQRLFEFVPRSGAEHGEVVEILLAELLDRLNGRVELGESADHALHQSSPIVSVGSIVSASSSCER